MREPRPGLRARRVGRDARQQVLEIERRGEHPDTRARSGRRPRLARSVGVDLHAVVVGVAQVERLGHAVIGGTGERFSARGDAAQRVSQLGARVVQQRDVEEPGVVPAGPRAGELVQDDEIGAAGAQRSRALTLLTDLQPGDVAVPGGRPREVGDRQVDGAEAGARGQRGGARRRGVGKVVRGHRDRR